jgi:multimeric flavodoxin WrbA
MKKYLFLLGSGRRDGNTEQLARRAAQGISNQDEQQWIHLLDYPLPPFEDLRHSIGVYPAPVGNEQVLFNATLDATDIVFATPLYWYSVSSSMKLYLDYWSAWMRVPGADFKQKMAGKTVWLISSNSDEDGDQLSKALIETLRLSAEYMKMTWGGTLLGAANRPGDIVQDVQNWDKAPGFFMK